MWARVSEIMLAWWLVASPLIFHGADPPAGLWVEHLSVALLVMIFASLSYWRPTRHAHLLSILPAGCLVVYYYATSNGEGAPLAQNAILTGMMIVMIAIIPNAASLPPLEWDQLHERLRPDHVAKHRRGGLSE